MVRVWHRPNGAIAIQNFVTDDPKLITRDCEAFLAENPAATFEDYPDLGNVPLPTTVRRFRNSWTKGPTGVVVDLDKARVQRLAEIRDERDKLLVASDGLMLRAQETGRGVVEMQTYRQALRDLPASINLSTHASDEALAAYAPAWPTLPDLA